MGNYIIDKVCCINNEDLLENEQHNSYNKLNRSLSNYSSTNDDSSPKLKNPTELHLPSNEIKFILNENKKITSLSNLSIGTENIIKENKGNPFNNYKIIKYIGNGSFGNVYMVEHNITKNIRSMKIIPKDNLTLGFTELDIIQEIDILKTLDHPFCVKLYEYYVDNSNYYLINEYCSDGDLNEKLHIIKYFPESIAKILMFQIFSGVSYLHSRNIFHGDLKLENIMVDNISEESTKDYIQNKKNKNFISSVQEDIHKINQNNYNEENTIHKSHTFQKRLSIQKEEIRNFELKFIDFGCAKMFNKYKKSFEETIGTLSYCSPEVLLNNYNEKCDIWSCGVILYVLLTGTYPFRGKNEEEISKKILNGKYEFDSIIFKSISNEAKDLIKKCLIYNKNERISAYNALKHPFFKSETYNLFYKQINCKNILFSIRNFSFTKHSKFYQIVLSFLSHNFAQKYYLKKLKKIFYKFDLNFDGKLSKDELYKVYQNEGINIELDELDNIIESIDFNNSGNIEYEEFIRVVIPKESLFTNLNLNAAFNFFDLNKNGFISFNEILKFFGLKSDIDINTINELKNEFLSNGNQVINFEQFKAIMISFAQEDMFNSIMRRKISDDDKDIFSENIDDNSLENSFD